MSSHIVEVCKIDKVEHCPNADRLDCVQVKGWNCVTGRDNFKEGDFCIYIPIDSILPAGLEEKIFRADSKIKLHNHRIRTIKLRGAISQGLVVKQETVGVDELLGVDVAGKLGITKYEPPVSGGIRTGQQARKRQTNPNFYKYTDIERWQNYPNVFNFGEQVSLSEKVHGTCWRAGWLPQPVNTLWRKILKLIHLLSEWQWCVGSRNVQLQDKLIWNGYYDSDVYTKIAKQYNFKEILKPGEVAYGEVYGWAIQKNYTYGCKEGEHKVALFDVMINGKYLDVKAFQQWAKERGLPTVKELYSGPFDMKIVEDLCKGDSKMVPEQKVIEGIVIKPEQETMTHIGRKVLKYVNPEYLLKEDNTDGH